MKSVISLTRLLEIVSVSLKLDPDLVRRASKSRAPAARGIMCPLAMKCDEDISEGRLRIDPATLLCISCARNAEAKWNCITLLKVVQHQLVFRIFPKIYIDTYW
jgi:hypothetical protein